jgi:hypothetical protein
MEAINTIIGLAIFVALLASPFYVIKWLRAADQRSAQKHTERLGRERQRTAAAVPGKAERAYFKSCTHCGTFALTLPFRDNLGRTYCSQACMQWLSEGPRTFCKKCTFESTGQSSGNLHTINGIGTAFVGSSDVCPNCKSVVRRVWFTFFLVPLIPLGRYRVMQISPQQFLSRKMRN